MILILFQQSVLFGVGIGIGVRFPRRDLRDERDLRDSRDETMGPLFGPSAGVPLVPFVP